MKYRSTRPPMPVPSYPTRGHDDGRDARYAHPGAYQPSPWAGSAYRADDLADASPAPPAPHSLAPMAFAESASASGPLPIEPRAVERRPGASSPALLAVFGLLFGAILAIGYRAHQNATEAAALADAQGLQTAVSFAAQPPEGRTAASDAPAASPRAAPRSKGRARAAAPARAAATGRASKAARATPPSKVTNARAAKASSRKPADAARVAKASSRKQAPRNARSAAAQRAKAPPKPKARDTRAAARPAPKPATKRTSSAPSKQRFSDAEETLQAARGATEHTL